MSIETVEVTKCDLCGEDLGKVESDKTMCIILGHGLCQTWPLATGRIADICKSCCTILHKAKNLGIIDYDKEALIQAHIEGRGDD